MSLKLYMESTVELAYDGLKKGKISRRDFMALAAIAGVTPLATRIPGADAAANEIVFWNWGGDAVKCHTDAMGAPFTKDTGLGYRIDSSGPLQGKIKAMVESGNVTADTGDLDAFDAISLGRQGLLEPIDYSIVDKKQIVPGFAWEYGASIIFYGYAYLYDTEKFGDNPPTTWADFFDTKKYPGKRGLYKWANGSIEGALLADGVAKDKLYPLDLPRAWKKLRSIKDDALYWGSGAESQEWIANGEVSMCMVWENRAKVIEADTNGRYRLNMNEAIAMPGAYSIFKGAPAGAKAVNEFIRACQTPERQVQLFLCHGQTPSNPQAWPLIPAEHRRFAITLPENFNKTIPGNSEWWADNISEALNQFLDVIGG